MPPKHAFVTLRAGLVVLAAVAGVAACGPGSSTASLGSGTTPAGTSVVAAPTSPSDDPDAGLRPGVQLKTALPTLADLPRGFHVNAAGVQDSGTAFGADPTATTLAHPDCRQLEGGNAWLTSLGQAPAFAQTTYEDGKGDQVFPEVDAYRGSGAKAVMAAYRRLFTTCRTFAYRDPQSGTKAMVSLKIESGPAVGDESLRAVLTTPAFEGGITVVAVRVGRFVVTVYDNSTTDVGAGAVGLATGMARHTAAWR